MAKEVILYFVLGNQCTELLEPSLTLVKQWQH